MGYACEDFYKLTESFQSENSSREILIAIGWLISTYEIIDICIKKSKSQIDEEYFKETATKVTKNLG